jgi:nucleoside-diphosphate-sugar epimerase
MRYLVLGATGPIGRAICRAGADLGAAVWAVSRRGAEVDAAKAIAADRLDTARIGALVAAEAITAVIDVVAMTSAETFPLLDALAAKPARYVLISSCDVYRNFGVLHRREDGPSIASAMSETAPLRARHFPYRLAQLRAADDPARWMDDYDKIPIEARAQESASDWTILRLPMVYGEGDKRRRFDWALQPMFAGRDVEAPTAWLDWVTTYSYIGNVADLCARAAASPACANGVFNVSDAPAESHRVWLNRLAAALGWRGVVRDDPNPDNPIARLTADLDLTAPLAMDGQALHRVLGWQAAFDLNEAMERTIAVARRSELTRPASPAGPPQSS